MQFRLSFVFFTSIYIYFFYKIIKLIIYNISIFQYVENLVEHAMGNLIGKSKKRDSQNSRSERISSNFSNNKPMPLPLQPKAIMPQKSCFGTYNSGQSSNTKKTPKKYALIPDNFTTLEQVSFFF